ncbi:hypothetical protein ACFC0D_19085 [Streptomyces sp. NPDC056222]|uniref:hypothetical protein n=1 Tax=Streptomyces sp. NPDC056222 TaxID=3345749 RepID=UPI0035E2FCF7
MTSSSPRSSSMPRSAALLGDDDLVVAFKARGGGEAAARAVAGEADEQQSVDVGAAAVGLLWSTGMDIELWVQVVLAGLLVGEDPPAPSGGEGVELAIELLAAGGDQA